VNFDTCRKNGKKWNEVLDWGYDEMSLNLLYIRSSPFL